MRTWLKIFKGTGTKSKYVGCVCEIEQLRHKAVGIDGRHRYDFAGPVSPLVQASI